MKRESPQVVQEWLVLNAKLGDTAALSQLLRRNQPKMLRHAFRLTGSSDAAQDIWQEAALAASRGIMKLRDPALFPAWLYRITTLKSRDWQRKSYRARELENALAHEPVATGTPADTEVHSTLNALEGEDKVILSLYYIDGFNVKEISHILNLGTSAVKTRLYRARKRFRDQWEGENT